RPVVASVSLNVPASVRY
nr:Chain I, Chain I/V [Bos taurus]6FO0_V Chain V, Chain I/V [Bos taurus]